MTIQAPYYPIIYIRGYAATMGEMEETAATPYMGFNLGSTKIRQDFENDIRRFIFESPLIRLMKDEGYVDAYRDGDYMTRDDRVPAKSVWVYRYYEQSTKSLGSGEKLDIEEYAEGLAEFIDMIKERVCTDSSEEADFKVYLVAHSMGGLVARCYLQNIRRNGDHRVDKFFTYGTPHNGIDMKGMNVPNLGELDRLHMSNFNRKRMRKYLKIEGPRGTPANSLDGAYPAERCFCFIGTNYKDYQAFSGLSRKGTGPLSDGLVMMSNAYVFDESTDGAGNTSKVYSPRAYAHRSHSGHYGLVNSEEGYQNLRRFLFGKTRIDVRLACDEITLPPRVQQEKDSGRQIRANYDIDVAATVRAGNVVLNERRRSQASAIRVGYDKMVKQKHPVYLFSGFLHRGAKQKNAPDTALAFAVSLAINVPVFEVDRRMWFDEHFEGAQLFRETLTFHLRQDRSGTTVRYGLAGADGPGRVSQRAEISEPDERGAVDLEIPLGFDIDTPDDDKPRPGFRGRLLLKASPWNVRER